MHELSRISATGTLERYGDREALLRTFHVSEQSRHAAYPMRCVTGTAPSLATVNEAYGKGTAEEWLTFQIVEFGELVGARDKLTPFQVKHLCRMILEDYAWLKLTDLELFLHHMKRGDYGRFYGTVDPQVFMQCFPMFLRDRNDILHEYYTEQERARIETEKAEAVTWEEYKAKHPDEGDEENPLIRAQAHLENMKKYTKQPLSKSET